MGFNSSIKPLPDLILYFSTFWIKRQPLGNINSFSTIHGAKANLFTPRINFDPLNILEWINIYGDEFLKESYGGIDPKFTSWGHRFEIGFIVC